MSKADNVALVKRAYKAFGKGDIKGVLRTLSADIEWDSPAVEGQTFSGSKRGKKEVEAFFQGLGDHEEVLEFEPQEFIAEGKQVVAILRYRSRVKATGQVAETPLVHVFTIQGGKVTRFFEIFDTAKAERAYRKAAAAAAAG
jgi:hypothetical protein